MGFLGIGLFIVLPVFVAIIGFIIGLFCFIGICLLLIGATGGIMNKMYIKQTHSDHGVANRFCNVSSVILGIAFLLFPLGLALFGIISSLVK